MDFHPAYRFHDGLSLSSKYENERTRKSPGTDFSVQGSFLLR
jgi:hypothetical protein